MKKIKTKQNKYAQSSVKTQSSIFTPGNLFNLNRRLSDFNPNVSFLVLFTIIAAVLSMIYYLFLTKAPFETASTEAVINAAIFFFSYLIARELDPDRAMGAYIAGFLALLASLFWGAGNVVVLFWMLMLARMLNRTAGQGAGLVDNLLILAATYWIVRDGQWGYAALTAIICAIESQLPGASHRSLYTAGFAFVIAALSPKIPYVQGSIPADMFAVMILSTILFLPIIKLSEHVGSKDDYTHQPLNTLRLQAAQIFTILAAFGMTWFYGENVIKSFMPVWAAVLGTGIYLPIFLLRHRNK